VTTALRKSTYPKLKAYIPFDSSGGNVDNRVAYDINGNFDPVEQAHYRAFAQDRAFVNK
jgi:hypothetical protein